MILQFHGAVQQVTGTSPLPTPPVSGVTAGYGDLVNSGVDRTALSNGASITQWDDQSGNGYHLDEIIGTTPTYDATNNQLDFTAGSLYNGTAPVITGSTKRTVFLVTETTTTNNTYNLFIGKFTAGPDGEYLFMQQVNSSNLRIDIANAYKDFSRTAVSNQRFIFTTYSTGTTISSTKVRVDGTELTQSGILNGAYTFNNSEGIIAGGGYINSSNVGVRTGSGVKNSEIIVYDRALTAAEIEQVENYLATKYGLDVRPSTAIKVSSAALIQQTGDNQFQFNANTNQAFSIATWFRFDSTDPNSFAYLTGRETASSNRHHQIYPYTSAGQTAFLTQTGGSPDVYTMTGFTALTKNKWYFVVSTATLADGGRKEIHLYDESGLVQSGFTTTYSGINANNNFKFIIFATRVGGYWSIHHQNSFGVWDRPLTSAEIEELWNSGNGLSYLGVKGSNTLTDDLNEWFELDNWDGTSHIGKHSGTVMVKGGSGTITNVST